MIQYSTSILNLSWDNNIKIYYTHYSLTGKIPDNTRPLQSIKFFEIKKDLSSSKSYSGNGIEKIFHRWNLHFSNLLLLLVCYVSKIDY